MVVNGEHAGSTINTLLTFNLSMGATNQLRDTIAKSGQDSVKPSPRFKFRPEFYLGCFEFPESSGMDGSATLRIFHGFLYFCNPVFEGPKNWIRILIYYL